MRRFGTRQHGWIRRTIASLALLLAAGGCDTSPLAPVAGTDPGTPAGAYGPEVLQVRADGTTGFVSMPGGLLASTPLPYGAEPEFDPRRKLSAATTIDGAVGGRLVCGLYVVTFPAGVFDGVGTVTMNMPDSTLMLCDLEVSPASLNDFKQPVELELHTTGTDADLDSLQIYWWDEETSTWVDMDCQKSSTMERVLEKELQATDPATGVRLPLSHFSRYATGKAGW